MKKRISRRQFLAALGVTAAAGVLAGCGGSDSSSASAASSGAASVPAGEIVYPTYPLADGTKTISVYMRDSTSGVVSNWGDIKCFQVAADKLGVNIQFIHPAVGSEADQFNLMIASGEYPDVIQWDFRSSAMSLEQLIDSGVLINMNDLIHTYAPNYLDLMESNESYRKEGVTNDGEYAAFYGYSGRAPLSGGPTIRADLLKEYGLEVPVTVDDWTNVLTAMKEHGHQYPMTTGKDRSGHVWFTVLFPAYQTSNSYCLDPASGEIVYGPITDNFRTYLAKMHEWYQDGLIDPEFMSNDGTSMNAKVVDGRSVAGFMQLSYHIANITQTARKTNPSFEFVGTTWPVLKEGDERSYFIEGGLYSAGNQAAITSSCSDPVLATQVLDYFYSQEGNDLQCWGIEGESYQVNEDGSKTYTDNILHNPDGKSASEAILEYAIPQYGFAGVSYNDSWMQISTSLPEQRTALTNWLDGTSGVNIPRLTVAAENQSDFNMIMNDVTTYVQEMYIQFITGQASLENDWETYVNTVNGMGMDIALQYEQDAYQLYQQR